MDLSSLASPTNSPSQWSSSSNNNNNTTPRARVQQLHSAPSASPPLGQSPQGSPFLRPTSSPSNLNIQRTLTPSIPRPPSPIRARSPDRTPTRVFNNGAGATTGGAGVENPLLRGQSDPFPATINHLPSSVSTRTIHSPTLRSPTIDNSHSSFAPTLSSSPSSANSSPLTSPNLHSGITQFDNNSHYSNSSFPSRRGYDSINIITSRRTSGDSLVGVGGPAGLLPPITISSQFNDSHPPTPRSRAISPVPLKSPPLVVPSSRGVNVRPKQPSRPPSSTASSVRHTRSHSVTSNSSSIFSTGDGVGVGVEGVSQGRAASVRANGSGGSTTTNGDRSLNGIDWGWGGYQEDDAATAAAKEQKELAEREEREAKFKRQVRSRRSLFFMSLLSLIHTNWVCSRRLPTSRSQTPLS